MTVAVIAKLVGKSPQTIHHHVNILLANDLLLATGTQKKRSRLETLYVWKYVTCSSQRVGATPEYLQQTIAMFNSVTRNMVREFEGMYQLFPEHPQFADLNSFYAYHMTFDPDQMSEVRQVFRETIAKLSAIGDKSKSGNRYHIVTFAFPTNPAQKKMVGRSESTDQD